MTESFFKGVDFSVPRRIEPPTVISLAGHEIPRISNEPNEVVIFDGSVNSLGVHKDIPGVSELWTRRSVITDFRDTMGQISGLLGVELPLDNREIYFLPARRMIPQLPENQQALVDRYGPYILNGIAGQLVRYPNNFKISLGYAGGFSKLEQEVVLETLAHEYGHSLGDHIDEAIFEEMKAEAFAALFMRFYLDIDLYCMEADGEDSSRLHDLATHRVGQLQTMGVSEEEMIAHLTEQSFGPTSPNDWESHLRSGIGSLQS